MSVALRVLRHRDQASFTGTILLMLGFAFALSLKPHLPAKETAEAPMEIRMQEAPPEAPPPVRPLPPPPPVARSTPTPPIKALPRPPVSPAPASQPAPMRTEAVASASPQPQALAAPTTPNPAPAPKEVAKPVEPAPAPVPAKPHAQVSDAYVAKLRAYVQGRKRYPTSREASLAKPTGTVRTWVILNRQGEVQEVGVDKSSDSLILDSEATKLLRSGHYPAFPDDAFPGQGSHKFYFDLDYQRSGDA